MAGVFKFAVLATLAALLVARQSLAAEIVLRHEPGGGASLVNSSLESPAILLSYRIARRDQGVDLLPPKWNSLQLQGHAFSSTSATVETLSEATVAEGLLFGPGQSRSIGIPFQLTSDADGNGMIDLNDFATWRDNQGQQLRGPRFGDFDDNGIVDLVDFDFLTMEMGNSAIYTFSATTIPEPATLQLLGLAAVSLFFCGGARRARRVPAIVKSSSVVTRRNEGGLYDNGA